MGDFPFAPGAFPLAGNVINIVNYGADPTGTKDSTPAITAAKAAAGTGSRNTILIPPGTYLTNPFTLDGFNWQGYGPYSSILKANAGSANYITNNTSATNEAQTIVNGIGFNGTNLTGTATVFKFAVGTPGFTAPSLIMTSCRVYSGPALGIDSSGAAGSADGCRFIDVTTDHNGSHGWLLGSDQTLIACVSDTNGLAGFRNSGSSSWLLTGCKSYGNGTVTPSSGHGFWLQGSTSGASMAGCQAQDNEGAGVLIDSATLGGYNVTGLVCDSNSVRSAGASPAVDIFESFDNYVEFVAVDRFNNSVSTQLNALRLDSTSTGNLIDCGAFYAINGGSVGNWLLSGTAAGNTLRLGNSGGTQAPVFASTITPDVPTGGIVIPGLLTGALTIAAPTNPWAGAELTFKLTQDTTGGRAVSWNAAFVFQTAWTNTGNTLNKRSTATFIYDGTSWISQNPSVNVWF